MTALRECIDKLSSDDEADRIYAAEDIGYANQAAGVAPLLDRLAEEPSRVVREAIFGALQLIEDDAVIDGALTLLDSEDSFLRNQAVDILRGRGPAAIPFLDRAFRDGNSDRRKFVIDILAKMRSDETSQSYDLALNDSDLNVVITTVESLGNRRKAGFRERIENLVSPDAHPMLLCACLEALAQLGDASSVDTARSRLGAPLKIQNCLRPSYLKLLGAKGRPEDVIEIAQMITCNGLEEPALNALTSLENRYRHLEIPAELAQPLRGIVARNSSPLLAYHAVRLMAGLLQEPAVFDFVERCLEAPEKSIRIGAIQAMREAGTEQAAAAVERRLVSETDDEVLQVWGGKSIL